MARRIPSERYRRSTELLARVQQRIPTGTQTFSKSALHFPSGGAPHFLERGAGGRVWDVDGNEYVDLVAALLAVMLGYRDVDVDAAIGEQLTRGISFSLATRLEGDLAERLADLLPNAEMSRFFKNGSDATAAAVRVARAATGRDRVVAVGYHGWHDWYVGSTVRDKGVPDDVRGLTQRVAYNDLDGLRAVFQAQPDQIAAVIMEPVHHEEPAAGYLAGVRELTRRHGVVLVFDEIITGCRLARGGAQAYFGVTADLVCLGKALANGMPLAALVGRRGLMAEFEDIFVSGTFGGEALSLAAAIAVVDKLAREPVIETLWETGRLLAEGMQRSIAAHRLESVLRVEGPAPMQGMRVLDHPHAGGDEIRTLYVVEMLARGVLTTGAINVMYAHGPEDVEQVLTGFDQVCAVISKELEQPGLAGRLGCPVIRPVFSLRSQQG